MAKITARGAHEVARLSFLLEYDSLGSETGVGTATGTLVMRSDGAVLRRYTGDTGSGYAIMCRLRPGVELTLTTLRRIAEKRGWVVTREGR